MERTLGGCVEFAVASRASVSNVIGSLRQTRRHGGSLLAVEDVEAVLAEEANAAESPLIRRAAKAGASDLHFVPCEGGLAVRARMDGVLRQIGHIPPALAPAAISRLKVHAGLDIGEHRRSQEAGSR